MDFPFKINRPVVLPSYRQMGHDAYFPETADGEGNLRGRDPLGDDVLRKNE